MLEIHDEAELKKLIAANKQLLVLFFASWCPSCRAFRPIFEKEIAKVECAVAVVCLDDEDNPLWDKYNIEFVPTVIYFKESAVSKRITETKNGLSREELLNFLKRLE